MYLIDEEDTALLKVGEDCNQISGTLDGGTVEVAPGSPADAVGTRVAQSLYGGLHR